jgi:hypothetical protein
MHFEREGRKATPVPSQAQLKRALEHVKSSFASLTRDDGTYLQVAGGPGLFALERRDANGTHFRAKQLEPVVRFEDGTILAFSGGELRMKQAEWFLLDQIVEILGSFASSGEAPAYVEWQQLSENFTHAR